MADKEDIKDSVILTLDDAKNDFSDMYSVDPSHAELLQFRTLKIDTSPYPTPKLDHDKLISLLKRQLDLVFYSNHPLAVKILLELVKIESLQQPDKGSNDNDDHLGTMTDKELQSFIQSQTDV